MFQHNVVALQHHQRLSVQGRRTGPGPLRHSEAQFSTIGCHLVPSEAGGKTPEVGFRQEVVEGREQKLAGCRGRDPLAGGVGASGVGQGELRRLFRGSKHLGSAPGGAAALTTDSHAEALEAAVRILLAQVERALRALVARAPHDVVLTAAGFSCGTQAPSLIAAHEFLVGGPALPAWLNGVAFISRGTALTAAACVAWGTSVASGLAICVQEASV